MEVENNNNCGTITLEEKALIVKLRQEIKDELPSSITSLSLEDQDLFLVRWLRARDLHLEKSTNMLRTVSKSLDSTNMLRTSLQWRKDKNVDQRIHLKVNPFFRENYPFEFVGTDKFGQPIVLIPLADWDFRKVVNNPERLSEFDDFVTFFFEFICNNLKEAHEKSKKDDRGPVTQVTGFIDVKNYSYSQLIHLGAMKKMLQMAKTYEAHYPEIVYRAIFINCPSYFGVFITMLKAVIPTKTIEKFTFYSQMSEWQNNIAELVDPTQIPEQYGGSKYIF